ncbi:hypothetical protein [Effusibacillus pohliae]|uniref:hypothetical protein n=1 Tax=Effusibacillus pohliae TaxID=232270 RepID=UPI0012E9A2FF|nr:hypothetical protein [Effusibacillus pohliae]
MNLLTILSNARWRLVPLFAIAICGISISDILKYGELYAANQWDILLETFNDPFKVAVLIPAFFFTMIVDTVTRDLNGWGYMIWNRGMSRAQWWWSKLGALFVTAFIYVSIFWILAIMISLFVVQFQPYWSKLVFLSHWAYQGGLTIHQLQVPPPIIFLKVWGLVTVGIYALAACVVLFAFVLGNAGIAWMIGAATCMISYGIWVIAPQNAVWGPTLHLVLLTHHDIFSKSPSYYTTVFSVIGGLLIIAAVGCIGHWMVLRRDF